MGDDADISMFTPIESIKIKDLDKGTQIRVAYDPNRLFFLTYLGELKFIVNEVEGSKNKLKGDILTITQLAVGHRLVVVQVNRNCEDLGSYEAAKFKGVKYVEIV